MATPIISVGDITFGESDSAATFVISLSESSTLPVTVSYNTTNITALNGSDYTAVSGSLTFNPGVTSLTVPVSLINNLVFEPSESFAFNLFSPTNALIGNTTATAAIIDNDAPAGTPRVSINDFVIDETNKQATFVVTLDKPSTGAVAMNYATQNGTALAGSDYVTTSGTLNFAAGQTAKMVTVSLINDNIAEQNETFNLMLSGLSGATTLDAAGSATIAANDGATVAQPAISVDDIVVGESETFADFVVRLDAPSANAVTVHYQNLNTTALNGSDYVAQSGTLTFAAGEMVKTVRISLLNDTTVEPAENFRLQLFSATNATIARDIAAATIIDNDASPGTPVVKINDFVIDEAAKEASFVVTLDKPSTGVVSMNYATQNGTALAGSDYTAVSGTLSFAPGETAKTVKVTLLNDTLAEPSEAFNLALSGLSGATSLDPVGTAVINENDAPTVAQPAISVDDIVVGESEAYADFVVRLNAPSTNTVTVNYQNLNTTALNGSDYVAQSDYLTFAPGETVKTVHVSLLNDITVEPAENFRLQLFSATNATIARDIAAATIIDNDASPGTPVVKINDFVIDEAAKEASFVVTLDKPSTGVVSMSYATQNGTALAGSDYVATSGTLSFAPGETAKTVKVTLLNDTLAEPSEAFNLALSGLSGATSLDPVGTAVINENDAPTVAQPAISVDDIVVGESEPYADFVVRLNAPSTNTVTVNYQNLNTTALNGSDYVAQSDHLTFAPGETVKTVHVSLLNDTTVEPAENFRLQLFSATNATIARDIAAATIIDNDASPGTPVVKINDFVIDEAAKEASFVVTLDKPSTGVVSMNYATQNGSALAGTDYVAATGSLHFAPGETTQTVKVTLTNDTLAESAEAFNLVLSSLSGATTLDAVGTAIIAANDATTVAQPAISVDDIVVGESDSYADFTVRLSAPSTNTVTVNYQNLNSTALNGSDYVAQSDYLTFAPGETVKTVHVSMLNDITVEPAENFLLQLFSPTNATLSRSLATATIIDNDASPGTPVVRVGDAVVDEKGGLARVTVTLDKPSTGSVTVNYAIQDVIAVDGADYRSFPAQKIGFAPGETSKTIVIGVLDDTTGEPVESFDVLLTSVSGATVGDGRAHVVIAGSDAPTVATTSISVANVAALESDGYVDFVVALSAPSATPVTVNYQNLNGTALNGSDYVAQSAALSFAPGETVKIVRETLINDINAESSEAFSIQLFSPSANATIGNSTATATIIDNDSPPPTSPVAISGTAGPDILKGTPFADSLTALGGNDFLDGGAGNDAMAGGTGNDVYIVEGAGDTVAEAASAGTDTVVSYINYTLGTNVENLVLGGSAITGTGNTLNNIITGNAGNNTLDGAGGVDTLMGGAGNDTYIVDNAADVITEGANAGTDIVQSSATYTLAANVENLTLTGAAAINATGNTSDNIITGNAANNVLNGATGIDTVSYANATAAVTVSLGVTVAQNTVGTGIDTLSNFENLTGSNFVDHLTGSASNNILNGGLGADNMAGGLGNDTYIVDNAAEVIVEGANAGTDIVQSSATYTLAANVENLTLTGAAAINATGNTLDNIITGNAANNVLNGAAGIDTVSYANATAGVTVSLGVTVAQSTVGAGTDTLSNFENLTGSNFIDHLTGSASNNILNGGLGADSMAGGLGNDTYVVDNAGDVVIEAASAGTDTVQSSATYTLAANVENLVLTGTAAINGTGNTLANVITGNAAKNVLTGGAGADNFLFNTKASADTVADFVSGTDKFSFSQAGIKVGDGDLLVEGGATIAGPGGFASSAELVIASNNISGAITAASAATAIGSATSAYAVGATALFAVDNGAQSGVFLFTSAAADATVSASELTLLATATVTPSTVLSDYLFSA